MSQIPGVVAPALDARLRDSRRWQAACVVALCLLGVLTLSAATLAVAPGEVALREGLLAWSPPEATALARVANYGGTWKVLLPAMVLVFALSAEGRRRWWLWCGVLMGSAVVETALKTLLARPRPEDLSAGFPSGHATGAAAVAAIVVYLAGGARLSPRARLALAVAAIAGALIVGLARIEVRAHWPSDVLAGWALGAGVAAAAAWWDLASGVGRPERADGRRLRGVPADSRAAGH